MAQSDWLEERSVSFLLSFSLSVFPFLFSRCRNRESSTTPRRNGEVSFGGSRRERKTTHSLSVAPLQQGKQRHISLTTKINGDCCGSGESKGKLVIRGAYVAEDYEAGGGLVDEEDNDGWVASHGRPKGCLIKMVLKLFDQGETKAYDRSYRNEWITLMNVLDKCLIGLLFNALKLLFNLLNYLEVTGLLFVDVVVTGLLFVVVVKVISHGYDVDVKNIVFLSKLEDLRVCKEHGLGQTGSQEFTVVDAEIYGCRLRFQALLSILYDWHNLRLRYHPGKQVGPKTMTGSDDNAFYSALLVVRTRTVSRTMTASDENASYSALVDSSGF
ncbi:hypothetical protein YC2023_102937 [Brassica napus]